MAATLPRDKHSAPKGPMVKILIENHVRGVNNLDENAVLPVSINGFTKYIPMGKPTEVPEEYVALLETCKSRTKVPDVAKAERAPRPQALYHDPGEQETWEYHQDYRVHRL